MRFALVAFGAGLLSASTSVAEPLKWVKPPELKLSEKAKNLVFGGLKCRV
jgi:hypothetical protein